MRHRINATILFHDEDTIKYQMLKILTRIQWNINYLICWLSNKNAKYKSKKRIKWRTTIQKDAPRLTSLDRVAYSLKDRIQFCVNCFCWLFSSSLNLSDKQTPNYDTTKLFTLYQNAPTLGFLVQQLAQPPMILSRTAKGRSSRATKMMSAATVRTATLVNESFIVSSSSNSSETTSAALNCATASGCVVSWSLTPLNWGFWLISQSSLFFGLFSLSQSSSA